MNRGRLLALAILLALAGALALAAAELYSVHLQNREAILAKQSTLGRLDAVIAQSDAVDRWSANLAQGLDDGAFLPGEGDALSSAELQARLVNITANSGAVLSSFRAMEPQPLEGLVDVGVEIALQGDFPSVHATIATIESSLPLFFLEQARNCARALT